MRMDDIVSLERIRSHISVSSKKRMLENVATLFCEGESELDTHGVFQALVERERLGSTAIGHGVALPHGRVKGLGQVLGAFVTLAHDVDYDGVDKAPVRMVFALLIPEQATSEQLQLLSELGAMFSDEAFCERLWRLEDPQEIRRTLNSCPSLPSRKAG